MKSRTYYIYSLSDPLDSVVRYIGATINPKSRLNTHLKQFTGTEQKTAWIKGLILIGLKPIMTIICECDCVEEAKRLELFHYLKYDSLQIFSHSPKQRVYGPSSRSFNFDNNKPVAANESPIVTLLRNPLLILAAVAREMYPNNKGSLTYLMKKMDGKLPFTEKDSKRAMDVLWRLKSNIDKLTAE